MDTHTRIKPVYPFLVFQQISQYQRILSSFSDTFWEVSLDNFRTVLSLRRTADMQIIIENKTPLFGKRIASHSSPSSVLNVTGGFPFPDGPPTDETPVLRGVSPLLWSLSPKGRSDSFRQKSKCLGIRGQISRSAQTTQCLGTKAIGGVSGSLPVRPKCHLL